MLFIDVINGRLILLVQWTPELFFLLSRMLESGLQEVGRFIMVQLLTYLYAVDNKLLSIFNSLFTITTKKRVCIDCIIFY